jgi:hypothetical protein
MDTSNKTGSTYIKLVLRRDPLILALKIDHTTTYCIFLASGVFFSGREGGGGDCRRYISQIGRDIYSNCRAFQPRLG